MNEFREGYSCFAIKFHLCILYCFAKFLTTTWIFVKIVSRIIFLIACCWWSLLFQPKYCFYCFGIDKVEVFLIGDIVEIFCLLRREDPPFQEWLNIESHLSSLHLWKRNRGATTYLSPCKGLCSFSSIEYIL